MYLAYSFIAIFRPMDPFSLLSVLLIMSKRISEVSTDSQEAPRKRASLLSKQAQHSLRMFSSPAGTISPAPMSGQDFEEDSANVSQHPRQPLLATAETISPAPTLGQDCEVQSENVAQHSRPSLLGPAETISPAPMLGRDCEGHPEIVAKHSRHTYWHPRRIYRRPRRWVRIPRNIRKK